MRVTSSMYYENLYGSNNSKLNKQLFDVNRQIASGLSIQYAKDNISTFTETMRLDNEIVSLGQIKKSTQSGYKVSNQTDIVLNEFESSSNRMRTLLVNAANGTNDATSLDAIAAELRGIESHLKTLANTSINGQYLFSGSAVDTKPIDNDGIYHGNAEAMNAFLGSRNEQQYNISGDELFLGEEVSRKRQVTSNVRHQNVLADYPKLQADSDKGKGYTLNEQSNIRDLMGDTDNKIDTSNEKHFFYLRGVNSDGGAFNKKITLKDDDTIEQLLTQIGNAYGNTPNLDIVNVTMNQAGQIDVQDKRQGSSKIDFHLVGAVDFSGGNAANVTNIDQLDNGETNFKEIINPTTPPAKSLFIKEFIKSPFSAANGAANKIDGLLYDRTNFTTKGAKSFANVAQINKNDNSFAKPSTKISDVADLSQGSANTLDGTKFIMSGIDINGTNYNVDIELKSSGSSFSLNGNKYDIYDVGEVRSGVDADKMTYQQLMDVMNMVSTGKLPTPIGTHTNSDGTPYTAAQEYDFAIYDSKFSGNTYLSDDGLITFEELNVSTTKAKIALYDENSGKFGANAQSSVLSFNANNALVINDAKTDFFQTIDKIITAVENYNNYPDGGNDSDRNIGIQNSISMLDDLQDHLFRAHSKVGSQSNLLTHSLERTELLEISTKTLRSTVVDTDLASASLELTQLTNNFQAMLSTVGKISKLSLVNYL